MRHHGLLKYSVRLPPGSFPAYVMRSFIRAALESQSGFAGRARCKGSREDAQNGGFSEYGENFAVFI